jgi:polyisoprenoid-binding protein YceI
VNIARLSTAGATRIGFLVLALLPGIAEPVTGQAAARDWSIDTSQSHLIIHVQPGGILSPALHPHHFQPETWSGEITWDPAHPRIGRVEVRVAADSLRDHQEKLSAKDVAKVEGQTRGPAVLDAGKFPQIVFQAHEVDIGKAPAGGKGEFRGTLTGSLTLHGKTLPLGLAIQGLVSATRFEAGASTTFKQSDFGIKPYSAAFGTISVKDEITLEILLVAVPADRKMPSASPSPSPRPADSGEARANRP